MGTRTLEALIRLSTAHAQLKLRKHEVLPEDVHEAYKLMMAAREEDVPAPPRVQAEGSAPDPDVGGDGMNSQRDSKRGKKRSRQEAGNDDEAISAARVNALTILVARVFARQQAQQIIRPELLEGVNAGLMEGEPPFDEEEFDAGLVAMENRNKIFISEDSGEVMLVG